MVTIKFNNYLIDRFNYARNNEYELKEGNVAITPDFSAKIYYTDSRAIVEISVEINDKIDASPFVLDVTVSGFFELVGSETEDDDQHDFKQMLSSNALAILYPYVRSLVSDLTLRTNEFPALTLPVINFVEIVNEEDKIEFIDMSQNSF
ncbi:MULTISPECIES: protein-export chaperone SecB [Lactobacillales]|uniref:protein-export chaperone SecB n=1 Tax=Lactobacillales TaxID=186826 RepID=UPI0011EFB893|nr:MULTISPECIES: protein-export chaperone SecB [unclassified Carnobacterium]KAF3299943.1 hypothetical protein FPV23_07410 [Carnobacterium sp. PL17RED31]KAF3301204.1 hypothetical protein FPV22_05540 [Carnobacterium sp. PL26RED25]KAF3305464.1 hypothetical protein FPV24_05685 [Carnobacterium sp. PL24RED07]KAF3306195.1 hypothetical protein FPV25_02355 [Carnobacterium sp. PL17GRE32]